MTIFNIIFLLFSFLNIPMPLPGNTYRKSISVPFFGSQTIETEFKKFNKVDIRLSGYINENGTAIYYFLDEDIDIKLSPNLNNILKKYKTEFILNNFDPVNQIIEIKLIIKPIFYKTNIKLIKIK